MYGIWFVWGVDCILLPEAGNELHSTLFPLQCLYNHVLLSFLLSFYGGCNVCTSVILGIIHWGWV